MARSLVRSGTALVVAALCCPPVAAQDGLSEKLAATQTWTMSAPRGQPTPDCVETWTFNTDGQLTVKSGDEIVTKAWRVGDDDEGEVSLFMRRLSSTGGSDCLGVANAAFDQPDAEEGGPLWVLEFNANDGLLLCNPKFVITKKHQSKMAMYDDENCWGELKPAP